MERVQHVSSFIHPIHMLQVTVSVCGYCSNVGSLWSLTVSQLYLPQFTIFVLSKNVCGYVFILCTGV